MLLTSLVAVNKPLTPHKLGTFIGVFLSLFKVTWLPSPNLQNYSVTSFENNHTQTPIRKFFRKLFIFVSIKNEQNKTAAHVQHWQKRLHFRKSLFRFRINFFRSHYFAGFKNISANYKNSKRLASFFLANFNSFFFLQSTILFQTSKSLLKVDILSRQLGGEMVATLLVEDGLSPGTNNLFNWKLIAIKAKLKRKMPVWEWVARRDN